MKKNNFFENKIKESERIIRESLLEDNVTKLKMIFIKSNKKIFSNYLKLLINKRMVVIKEKCGKFLIQKKIVNPALQNNYFLRIACQEGLYDFAAFLLNYEDVIENKTIKGNYTLKEHFYNYFNNETNLLILALQNKNFNIFELLLGKINVDLTTNQNNIIYLLVFYNKISLLKKVLQYPEVNPSDNDNISFFLAYNKSYTDIVKLLWSFDSVKIGVKNRDKILYNKLSLIESINKF